MSTVLVGSTGFVGSNIYHYGKIDQAYHSVNIADAYGTNPDLLIYAGLRAEKYLANKDPEKDYQTILEAQENIQKIHPKKLVLISTVDVLKDPSGKDEHFEIDTENLAPYGLNRYRLEQWVREQYPDALIIRLPGLFGLNIKKNFLYDYLNVIPFMLKQEKFLELSEKESILKQYYTLQDNGFYKCNALSPEEKKLLKETFRSLGFTAMNFTDSRNVYQFYPLSRLAQDIETALKHDIRLWHPATEPVSAAEVYSHLTGEQFRNECSPSPVYYDYKTCHAELFGGKDGYIMNKQQVLNEISAFADGYKEAVL